MPKQLRIKDVDRSLCLTVRELDGFLQNLGGQDATQNVTPVILKCGGKNYRLASVRDERGVPVLVGKRTNSRAG